MSPYNLIFTLHAAGLNNSEIERTACVSRKTVISVLKLAEIMDFNYADSPSLSDLEIHRILHPKKRSGKKAVNMETVIFRLGFPNQTIKSIWQAYVKDCEASNVKSYSLSMFQYMVAEAKEKMPIVAYDGTLELKMIKNVWIDEERQVSILFAHHRGCAYVTTVIVHDDSVRTWIHSLISVIHKNKCTIDKCRYIGRIPKRIIAESRDCLKYYGIELTQISSRDASEDFQSWITETLIKINEDVQMSPLDDILLNACTDYNNKYYKKCKMFTRQAAFDIAKECINQVYVEDYDFIEYTELNVQPNYHVRIDGMFYSIPFEFRHEKLIAYISDKLVEIQYNGTIIAVHDRLTGKKNRFSTESDHVPSESEIPWGELSGTSLRRWAGKIGKATYKVINSLLSMRSYEVQGYMTCNTILHLSTLYGDAVLEKACETSLKCKQINYPFIKDVCKELL